MKLDKTMLLQSSLVSYFQTGNPFIDGFILCIIGYIFTSILENKLYYKKQIKKVFSCSRDYTYKMKLLSYEYTSTHRPIFRSSNAFNAVTLYLKEKCHITNISENAESFKGTFLESYTNHWDDTEEVQSKTGYSITEEDTFFIEDTIYGRYKINQKETKENESKGTEIFLVLMSNKSMEDIYDFIKKCIHYFEKRKEQETNKGPFIFTYRGKEEGVLQYDEKYFRSNQTFENTIFDNKEQLVHAVSKFTNDLYYEKHPHITRKLIPLFYGEPGTGKTFAIRLLAKELQRHIVILPINKIQSSDELEEVLFCKKIKDHKIDPSKIVFVIEDLDAMTDLLKKRNIEKSSAKSDMTELVSLLKKDTNSGKSIPTAPSKPSTLTMSDVLNTLDGIYKLDNFVIAFSTNHIEQLDKAFLRDQRITHKIEFTKCSKKVLQQIIEQWYESSLSEKDCKKLEDYKYTLANIATICDRCNTIEECMRECIQECIRDI